MPPRLTRAGISKKTNPAAAPIKALSGPHPARLADIVPGLMKKGEMARATISPGKIILFKINWCLRSIRAMAT